MNKFALSTKVVPGSLAQVAKTSGKSLAETFVNADCIIIVDTSGSMDEHDSRGGRTRYEIACEELASLQNNLAGKIAVLAFSNDTIFCPNGVPQFLGGSTNLAGALKFAKMADVPGIRFIVISDGQPDSKEQALAAAKTYKNRIDVIYVGPETYPAGRDFLQKLAQASGGIAITADRAKELAEVTQRLLLTA
jgi:hypothetical protein